MRGVGDAIGLVRRLTKRCSTEQRQCRDSAEMGMGAHEKIYGLVLVIGFKHSMYIIEGVASTLVSDARNFASLTEIGIYICRGIWTAILWADGRGIVFSGGRIRYISCAWG